MYKSLYKYEDWSVLEENVSLECLRGLHVEMSIRVGNCSFSGDISGTVVGNI